MLKHLVITSLLLLIACQPENKGHGQQTINDSLEGYWYQQPMRLLQTVLRQPDAANYDVDSLVRYMQQVHSNVLVINGGGIVDYFQNTLPMANINPYIGDRDLLAEIVEGCHNAGIKVIARVDFRGVHQERYNLHPDWFAKDENGAPIILDYTAPELYAPCYNGYYRTEHSVAFISQLFEKYHVDGIWHNSVNFHHTCYCDKCQELFQDSNQKKLPIESSSKDEWEAYYKWNEKIANKQLSLMRSTVKKYGEDKSYAAEVFDMYRVEQQKHTGINLYSAAEYFDFSVTVSFIANNSSPVVYKDIYYPSAIVRFLKSLEPDKSPVILFGGNGTEHRYIYDPPVDSRIWLWEAAGTGGGFWNCYFNGSFPANTLDRRNAYMAKDAYQYVHENEALIQKLQPVTDIGIFYSKATGQILGDDDFSLPVKGTLRLLEEGHYQYGFISDRNLTKQQLAGFKVLIMPNVVGLSNDHATIIREWVKEGGKLIATFQTSLFDDQGTQLNDFLLGDVFGVSYDGIVENTAMDCYQKVVTRNQLLKGFEQTRLLHNGGNTLMVNANNDAITITGFLPKINNQPPENAFPLTWSTNNPIVVENTFGKGRVVYFANEVAKLNYTIGHPDYRDLMMNSINSLLGKSEILTTNAPASVHVYLNKTVTNPDIYQLSLVNASSTGHRPFRDIVKVSGITVDLPFEVKYMESLFDGNPDFSLKGKTIIIDDLYEFCAVKLGI